MKRNALYAVALSSVFLFGCGGGDDGPSEPVPPTIGPLSQYVGTYSECSSGEKVQVVISQMDSNTLAVDYSSNYYANRNCTGAVVGVETYSAPARFTYVSTGTATVIDWPSDGRASSLTVDRFNLSAPRRTSSLTGSGVTRSDGRQCVTYGGGIFACLEDSTLPAVNVTGGLAVTDTAVLLVVEEQGVYVVDSVFPR